MRAIEELKSFNLFKGHINWNPPSAQLPFYYPVSNMEYTWVR